MNFPNPLCTRQGGCARPWRRLCAGAVCLLAAVLLAMSGCSPRWNTLYNAKQAFNQAERAREEAIKEGQDVQRAVSGQRQNYLRTIEKAQKALDMFPGHSTSDEALFLQGKAHHRLASYRMSIRQFDLLRTNFPKTPYMEEVLFLQAVNYLMINDAARSQDFLDLLERQFPESRFQAEALRAGGDNAFALKDWDGAVRSFSRYLDRHPRGDDWESSSLRLAESLWELARYDEATDVLRPVKKESAQADRVFRARLLLSRCLIHQGDLDAARSMVSLLKNEAEIHGQEGMVALIEAEILLAAGQRGTAISMLENMDPVHLKPEIKPLWADMLGHAYLADEKLDNQSMEKAREYFQQAVSGAQHLDDPEHTRRLLGSIREYLTAENQLPDAQPQRAARMRLQQANALLFDFQRPRMAYDLFATLAADSAADTTVAPRALYGAMLLQESTFNEPDSAQLYAQQLLERYPDSPQAYRVRSGAEFDLLAFLLTQELAAQRAAFDGMIEDGPGAGVGLRPGMAAGTGLRRQMIYLQRRPNMVFPPPPAALKAQADRIKSEQDAAAALAAKSAAPEDRIGIPQAPDHESRPATAPPSQTTAVDSSTAAAAAAADTQVVMPPEPAMADTSAHDELVPERDPEPEPEPEPESESEPKRPRRWDF